MSARIDPVIRHWQTLRPSFLWAPTTRDSLLLDRAKGVKGKPSGLGATVRAGGLPRTIANGADYLEFPTNAGVAAAGSGGGFCGVMLVSIEDPASLTGAFIKIGTVDGLGFGAGSTTFEDTGTRAIVVGDGVAWYQGPTDFFAKGLNVISFGVAQSSPIMTSHAAGTEFGGIGSYLSASPIIGINGYQALRTSNAIVHAVAIFPQPGNTNTTYSELRAAVVAPVTKYRRLSRAAAVALFEDRGIFVPVAAAGGGGAFKPAWARRSSQIFGSGVR